MPCLLQAAESDSLRATVSTSLSVGTPAARERIIHRPDGTEVVSQNPFDYLLGIGVSGSYGRFVFTMDYAYERLSGLDFVNIEYRGRYTTDAYEVGYRLIDREYGANLYLLSIYAEGRILGWVGVGVTREHYKPWLGDGATLARFSLARNRFDFWILQTTVRLEYETKPNANRFYFQSSIRNFQFERFSITPQYEYERVKPPNRPSTAAYRGRLVVSMKI